MDGEIRYIPAQRRAPSSIVSINTIEFLSRDSTNAAVDRANN